MLTLVTSVFASHTIQAVPKIHRLKSAPVIADPLIIISVLLHRPRRIPTVEVHSGWVWRTQIQHAECAINSSLSRTKSDITYPQTLLRLRSKYTASTPETSGKTNGSPAVNLAIISTDTETSASEAGMSCSLSKRQQATAHGYCIPVDGCAQPSQRAYCCCCCCSSWCWWRDDDGADVLVWMLATPADDKPRVVANAANVPTKR